MILCVGPTGSGKTSLIERLSNTGNFSLAGSNQPYDESHNLPTTSPTVGTNLTTIHTSASSSSSKRSTKSGAVVVRELGGAMMPIWHNYFRECNSIMFVTDSSDFRQVACTSISLLTVLAHDELAGKAVSLVFNKSDLWRSPGAAAEFKWLLRLDDLVENIASRSVTVLDTSAKSGAGLAQLKQWLVGVSKY